MAIITNTILPVTNDIIAAYVNVNSVNVGKNVDGVLTAMVIIKYYISEEERLNNVPQFKADRYFFPYDIDSADNVYIQSYNFLKTLSQFTDAVDA